MKNYQKLPELLLPWYEENARDLPWRRDRNPYHIWVSEIMLQQTRVDTVIDYYNRFLATFPTIDALAAAAEEKVLKLWEGLGYYSRARNLHKTAQIIVSQYGGDFPANQAEIIKLPGIGSYTSGAILSIAFEKPTPAVDGNVLRVIARITNDDRCIDEAKVKRDIGNNLAKVYPADRCGDFTQSLMELGATVCLPNGKPLCEQCPVAEICVANQSGAYESLPVRKEKKPRKVQELTVFIFICGDRIALQKRKEKGVLEGMWELPNIAGILENDEALRRAKIPNNIICEIQKTKNAHHIFTHIEWQMRCYYISCSDTFGDYIWADAEALEKEYSIPTAFKKLLEMPRRSDAAQGHGL